MDRDLDSLPEGYVHNIVADQIYLYRQIYTVESSNKPGIVIKSLGLIAMNAFALAHDVVKKAGQHQSEEFKIEYINILTKLWENYRYELKELTSKKFQYLNFQLALIIERYNENKNIDQDEVNYPFAKKKITKDNFSSDLASFIIYDNPDPIEKRNIKTERFVEEFYHRDFTVYCAIFDVFSLKREKPTKKDPHYCGVNGTFSLLLHDFSHFVLNLVEPMPR